MLYVILGVSIITLILVIALFLKNGKKKEEDTYSQDISIMQIKTQIDQLEKLVLLAINNSNENLRNELKSNINFQIEQLRVFATQLDSLSKTNEIKLGNMNETIQRSLSNMQQDNANKLELMRQTVDEKLNATLETRLTQSFAIISQNLDKVQVGLGEMRSLASSVGDIKKVLSNVKMRGTLAEVQLGNLLEQMLVHGQFDAQVTIRPGLKNIDNKVDYVIKLPGKDEGIVLLPIDSKFPLEKYQILIDVYEHGSNEEIEKAAKQFEDVIKKEASSISEKYIYPPKTTEFAIMYLALEGLYAEVVKRPGLMELLQSKYGIVVCGPSTLCGLLNSLQLGFKTLAIEKRSTEIWALLSMFKKEFGTFVELLGKTQKQLTTAGNTIEEATKKSQIIARKLDKVALDDSSKPTGLLEDTTDEE